VLQCILHSNDRFCKSFFYFSFAVIVELPVLPEFFDILHIMERSLSMLHSFCLQYFSISLAIYCISSTEKFVSLYSEFLFYRNLLAFFYKHCLAGLSDPLKHLNWHTETQRMTARDLWRSSCPASLLKQGHLELVVQTVFEYSQTWRLHTLPGQPIPVLSHPRSTKMFPGFQSESPLLQFVPVAPGPITGYHWTEPSSVLYVSSLQVFIYFDENPPEPSPAWTVPALSAFPRRRDSPSLTYLGGPLLDSVQYVHDSLVLGSPELDSTLQVWAHQCLAEEKDVLFDLLARLCLMHPRLLISLPCSEGTLLVHVHRGVHKHAQGLFGQAVFQLGGFQCVLVHLFKKS